MDKITIERETLERAIAYLEAPTAKLWPAGTLHGIAASLRAALAAQPADAQQEPVTPTLPPWWFEFIVAVCELPDRNSPEGEPDAMVATEDELASCALAAIERTPPDECVAALKSRLQAIGDLAASCRTGPGLREAMEEIECIAAAQPAEPVEPVAWLRFQEHADRPTTVHLCDSDHPRAFQVYAAQPAPAAVPPGYALVPIEPTPEMVAAYLSANTEYWRLVDGFPPKIGVWRNGTPSQATAESYRAMIAAAKRVAP